MHVEPTVFITNREPIEPIKTLREIMAGVIKTLESFNPEF